MKAIVGTKFGPPQDVLKLEELQKPTPSDNEVLVEVHAASVNYVDGVRITGMFLARLMALAMGVGFGLLKPKHKIPEVTWRVGLKRLAET